MTEKMVKLEESRIKLHEEYKGKIKRGIIGILFGALFAGIGFIFSETEFLVVIGIIIMAISAGIFFGQASKIASNYSKKAKSKLVQVLLDDLYENATYEMDNRITTNEVVESGLVNRPDREHGNDLIICDYKGVNIKVSDLHYEKRVTRVDSKGNTYTTYETFFKGRYYIFKFNREFEHGLKIIEKSLANYTSFGRKYSKYETESINFNKKFNIYATDQQFMFFIVTPLMLEKFQELEAMHRGHIGFSLVGNELKIAVNDSRDYLEVSLKKPINEESVKVFQADTDIMASIINEFRLHTDKFNRQ